MNKPLSTSTPNRAIAQSAGVAYEMIRTEIIPHININSLAWQHLVRAAQELDWVVRDAENAADVLGEPK